MTEVLSAEMRILNRWRVGGWRSEGGTSFELSE